MPDPAKKMAPAFHNAARGTTVPPRELVRPRRYLDDAFAATAETLGRRVARHYFLTLFRQAHRVCGSLDLVTRAPMHAVRSVGGGVQDLLWQPVDGLSSGGARGLASGAARGAGSLVGGTFDAGMGVASAVTAGAAGALAALSMDSAYQTKRSVARAAEQNDRRGKGVSSANNPSKSQLADAVEKRSRVAAEVVRGAQDLGSGIFDGVTGIVVEPYRAVARGGDAVDVMRATARGLVGVAIKPAVGVIDMSNRAVEGVRGPERSRPKLFEETNGTAPANTPHSLNCAKRRLPRAAQVRTAGKYATDTFQAAVTTKDDAGDDARSRAARMGRHGPAWRRRARLDPASPWARLAHPRLVGPNGSRVDAEAAETLQVLRLAAGRDDGDRRVHRTLAFGAALDDAGGVRWTANGSTASRVASLLQEGLNLVDARSEPARFESSSRGARRHASAVVRGRKPAGGGGGRLVGGRRRRREATRATRGGAPLGRRESRRGRRGDARESERRRDRRRPATFDGLGGALRGGTVDRKRLGERRRRSSDVSGGGGVDARTGRRRRDGAGSASTSGAAVGEEARG